MFADGVGVGVDDEWGCVGSCSWRSFDATGGSEGGMGVWRDGPVESGGGVLDVPSLRRCAWPCASWFGSEESSDREEDREGEGCTWPGRRRFSLAMPRRSDCPFVKSRRVWKMAREWQKDEGAVAYNVPDERL